MLVALVAVATEVRSDMGVVVVEDAAVEDDGALVDEALATIDAAEGVELDGEEVLEDVGVGVGVRVVVVVVLVLVDEGVADALLELILVGVDVGAGVEVLLGGWAEELLGGGGA